MVAARWTLLPLALGLVLFVGSRGLAEPTEARPAKPSWSKSELKDLFIRIQTAGRAPTIEAQDQAMVQMAGAAYRVRSRAAESVESYARRTLRTRDPNYPAVKKGQWLLALTHTFYVDASARSAHIAKFELSAADRRYFERMAEQTRRFADVIGQQLELTIEGLDGVVEPLAAVDGEKPARRGAMVRIHSGGTITIENMDRVKFEGHQPPAERPRTEAGALRELFSAQRQYNVSAEMLGRYDRASRRNYGHVQVVLPASYPARYLNEVVRGSKQAGMHTLHLMTMSKRGELRELRARLRPKKKARRRKKGKVKTPALVQVRCDDEETTALCAKRIRHVSLRGEAQFVID